jgi:glycerol uptake facilitator-like aquaporin
MNGGVTVPSVEYGQAFALEFIISFNLMFVVTAVATDTRAVSIYYIIIIYIFYYKNTTKIIIKGLNSNNQ